MGRRQMQPTMEDGRPRCQEFVYREFGSSGQCMRAGIVPGHPDRCRQHCQVKRQTQHKAWKQRYVKAQESRDLSTRKGECKQQLVEELTYMHQAQQLTGKLEQLVGKYLELDAIHREAQAEVKQLRERERKTNKHACQC